jgi:rubrerythrin
MAESEEIQAQRILYLLRGTVADSGRNGREVLEEELPMLQNLYQKLRKSADRHGVASVRQLSSQKMRVNMKNGSLMKKARAGNKAAGVYRVCSFCGYVHEGEPPEKCPVCQAPRKRFREVEGGRSAFKI